MQLPPRFIVALGLGVLVIWALSVVAQIVSAATGGNYETPIAVHGMMGTIVGVAFGERQIRKRNGAQ